MTPAGEFSRVIVPRYRWRVVHPLWSFNISYRSISALENVHIFKIRLQASFLTLNIMVLKFPKISELGRNIANPVRFRQNLSPSSIILWVKRIRSIKQSCNPIQVKVNPLHSLFKVIASQYDLNLKLTSLRIELVSCDDFSLIYGIDSKLKVFIWRLFSKDVVFYLESALFRSLDGSL